MLKIPSYNSNGVKSYASYKNMQISSHYHFEMIFSKCHILCSSISKKLKNRTIKLLYGNVAFYHESFSANKISKNVKINEIY